jgi:hypothetical protein
MATAPAPERAPVQARVPGPELGSVRAPGWESEPARA